MWPDRRLIDLFGTEHPLILAPMAGFGALASSVSHESFGNLGPRPMRVAAENSASRSGWTELTQGLQDRWVRRYEKGYSRVGYTSGRSSLRTYIAKQPEREP
jgi:hypothetical protein